METTSWYNAEPLETVQQMALFSSAQHLEGVDNGTNHSALLPDTELSRFSRGGLTFAAVMTILIMITGLVGNLLTIVALLRCPRVRNVAAAFIVSLCIADFIFCLLVLPFSSSRFIHGKWIHGPFLCTLFPLMRYGNVGVSLLSIAMITINRYIMIAHYNIYSRLYKPLTIGLMIGFCWAFSYLMQLPTLFGVWGQFGKDEKLGTCSIIADSDGRSSKAALFVIAFVLPCVIIIGCYARIFWVVHSSEARMRQHERGRLNPPGASNLNSKGNKKKEEKLAKTKRNEWRITQMVLAIFLSYVVCYLPITIVKIADVDVLYPGFHILGYLLLYFSACVNPIIYVIMNKQYRQAYKTILLCKRPRLVSTTPANQSSFAEAGNKANASGWAFGKHLNTYETSNGDKGPSKTMVSQVSFALNPIGHSHRNNHRPPEPEIHEVFEDPNEKL